tara:strand:- start:12460 stop:13149 length:690 start_codon:yes stop_codon:yes gene_type:complete
MHDLLGTRKTLTNVLADLLQKHPSKKIVDLCSGSGGPMPEVVDILRNEPSFSDLSLTLTDLFPDDEAARSFNGKKDHIHYQTTPVDATDPGALSGIRTMVSSFHHMKPDQAISILRSAAEHREAICIYEISDNTPPVFLWWIALIPNFIMSFFVTLKVRPVSWQQIVFTYLIPIIPLVFAWDGAVSNVRTYTLNDLDELLRQVPSENYVWEKGTTDGRMKQLYMTGYPV